MSWKKFLCDWLNCGNECSKSLEECLADKVRLQSELDTSNTYIEHLLTLLPRPEPPKLDYKVEKSSAWIGEVLAKYKANVIRLPLGQEAQFTDKSTFLEFVAWDWVDQFEYHKFYRCGNFAISFKAHADQFGINQVGIVLDYQAGHAYNIVIFPDGSVMILEPQNDQIWYWEDKDLPFYVLEGAVVII